MGDLSSGSSFLEAPDPQAAERSRLRHLLQDRPSRTVFPPEMFSTEDLDLIVGYLCDESLHEGDNYQTLRDLLHAELSEESLERIHDHPMVIRSLEALERFLAQKNLPRLTWLREVRVHFLREDRLVPQDEPKDFLDRETQDLLRTLDPAWDRHDMEGFLLFWERTVALPRPEREVFLTLLSAVDWNASWHRSEELISEFFQVAALV